MDAINNNKINSTSTSKLGSADNYLDNTINLKEPKSSIGDLSKSNDITSAALQLHQEYGNKGTSVYTLA